MFMWVAEETKYLKMSEEEEKTEEEVEEVIEE